MSEDTVRVRVSAGEFRYERDHYTRGDELDVEPKTLEKHPRSLERVEDTTEAEPTDETSEAASTGDADDSVTVADLDPHPDDLTVDDLKDRVADVEDVALLETILEAERAGDETRTTAVDAIEARIAELED